MQHLVGRALIAGLCAAGFVAIVALATGEFDDTHLRVIGTAFGFSVFAAFAGAGDALRDRADGGLATIGAATLGVSIAAFVLLLIPLWVAEDDDAAWQAWGVAAVLSLCGSHVSLVLRGARDDDTPAIRTLVTVSLGAAVLLTLFAVLAIAEAFDDVGEGWGRLAAVLLVILLLATALPPLLRRFAVEPAPARAERPAAPTTAPPSLADELVAAADRIERIEGRADARREAERLRELATRAQR